jgi:predicted NBD/HSP70 family sugar kinase
MNVERVSLDQGVGFGIGGTNFRTAIYRGGELEGFACLPTPAAPEAFYRTIVRRLLQATEEGATYAVVGVPGTVEDEIDDEGHPRQRLAEMPNIPGLARGSSYPMVEMTKADPAISRYVEEGFEVLFTNDGNLAVQAAAEKLASGESVLADIIVGTGVGGAVAKRDKRFPGRLYHADPAPLELGHNIRDAMQPLVTDEDEISGPAIESRFKIKPEDLPSTHPAAVCIAARLAVITANLGMNAGAELVVYSGGVNVGAQESIESPLKTLLDTIRNSDNKRAGLVPEKLLFVPSDMQDEYELYGTRRAMQSHLIQKVISAMVQETMQLDHDATSILHAAKFRGALKRLAA